MSSEFDMKQIEYVRGKTAGNDVLHTEGSTIVAKGQVITDDVIDNARHSGMLHYLMIAAVSSAMPPGSDELVRRMQEFREVTEGHEAEFVRGKTVGRDVRDFGNDILISEGETVTDHHIEIAQREGLLGEVVLAVGASGLSGGAEPSHRHKEIERPATKMGYTPFS